MLNADGSYSPPDTATRHVLVVTQAHDGTLGQQFAVPVPAGYVLATQMRGATNFQRGPKYQHPQAGAAWIEHATAKPMDVLPMDEVTPLVAQAQARMAAVQAFWAAERAKVAQPGTAA